MSRADASVTLDDHRSFVGLDLDGDGLRVEPPFLGGPGRSCMRVVADPVQVLARQSPHVGDHLGGKALGNQLIVVSGAHLLPEGLAGPLRERDAHRHPGHRLDAGGDNHVIGPGHHALRGEVRRLLARAALAVDRQARDRLRPTRSKNGVAADIEGLFTHLGYAAHDHVVDELGIQVGPFGQGLEGLGGQVRRMPVLQSSVPLAHRGADGVDDHGFRHEISLSIRRGDDRTRTDDLLDANQALSQTELRPRRADCTGGSRSGCPGRPRARRQPPGLKIIKTNATKINNDETWPTVPTCFSCECACSSSIPCSSTLAAMASPRGAK